MELILPGATGPALTSLTGQDGSFLFDRVPPGDVRVRVEAVNGLAGAEQRLPSGGRAVPLRFTLLPEAVTETVAVDAEGGQTVDASENRDSVSAGANLLDHLPIFDQNIAGALLPFLDTAATAGSGVSLVVDGMEMKNINVSPSAIAEVRINSDPYSAEFASAGRGRLEITTKPTTTTRWSSTTACWCPPRSCNSCRCAWSGRTTGKPAR